MAESGGYDAGTIFVSLRAQLADFNAGIDSAKKTLDSLAQSSGGVTVAFTELDTSVQVFTEIETRSARVGRAFASMGAQAGRSTQTLKAQNEATDQGGQATERANVSWARAANRILGVQIALIALTQHGTGPVKEAFQALSNGISVAAASFQLLQGKIGLAAAGFIGLGVAAVSFLTRILEEGINATNAMSDQMDKTRKSTEALSNATNDANNVLRAFGGRTSDELLSKLHLEEAAYGANIKRIRELSDEIRKLTHDSEGHIIPPWLIPNSDEARLESLKQERLNLQRNNETIGRTSIFDKANAEVGQLLQSTRELKVALQNVELAGEIGLRLGIETPAQAATANLQAARGVLQKLIEDDLKIFDESKRYGLSDEQRAEILKKQHSSTEIKSAVDKVKADKAKEDSIKAVHDLAQTFSTSVGDGLRDAILNAKKPMEALAGIGTNLFGNMVDQLTKRLESGLSAAFTAISGAAGEGVGLALTGILGAAGGILSKLGSKGSDSFNPVQSAITSSQAVRGIVAGPSSVAIATVGDDLQRAVAPVVSRLDGVIGWLSKIEGNTRGGRSGGGSNVAVASA